MGNTIGELCHSDKAKKPDILMIMGTSLTVHGIKGLVRSFACAVHASSDRSGRMTGDAESPPKKVGIKRRAVIYVNLDPPPSDIATCIDYWVEGCTDEWVKRVEIDWRSTRPWDWEAPPTTTSEDVTNAPTILPSVTIARCPQNAGRPNHRPLIPPELMPSAFRLPPPTGSRPNILLTSPPVASKLSPLIPPHLMPMGTLEARQTLKLPVMNQSSPMVPLDHRSLSTRIGANTRSHGVNSIELSSES